MPISVRSKKVHPGETAQFTFPDNVVSFTTGIAYWSFNFGSNDHHVRKLSLGLTSNQSGNTINVKVNGTLSDDNGGVLNASGSYVTVCIVAVTGSVDYNITLANANAISSNGASSPINLPGTSLGISQAFIAGFDFVQEADHHVRKVVTAAGFSANGTTGQITSHAQLNDDRGHDATATINGGLVAANTSETGIRSSTVVNQQTTDALVVDFGRPIAEAVVMIQDLEVTFDGDHHVLTFGGGTTGWVVNGNTVALENARAFMKDSHENQVNKDSWVSLVVFAVPA